MRRYAGRSGRLGSLMMPIKPSGCCAISPVGLTRRRPVSPPALEGLDEMLTVIRLGLPVKLRRSLACTNSIENMMGTLRRVCRNVKRWRNAAMALRWTAAGMMEAAKGFRRLKAYKHLPVLRAALAAHQSKYVTQRVEHDADAA